MSRFISLCAAASIAVAGFGLVGCQDNDRGSASTDTNHPYTSNPNTGTSTTTTPGTVGQTTTIPNTNSPTNTAAQNSSGQSGPAGVPDRPGASSAAPTDRRDSLHYGNQKQSGTLSGGTANNPDANTPGGG